MVKRRHQAARAASDEAAQAVVRVEIVDGPAAPVQEEGSR